MKTYLPYVKADFEQEDPFYIACIERILHQALPSHFFELEDSFYYLLEKLPIVCWTPLKDPPFELSFFMLARFRTGAFRFFAEMISKWLIPGKRLNTLMQFATDLLIPKLGSQKYICGEIKVRIQSNQEMEVVKKNLPVIESEIRTGMESYYQACRILEIKGLTCDEKTALIQENIVALIKHRPQDFDYDILSEMQHFLVLCKEEFKQLRGFKHMSRIICVHYLFRRALKLSLEVYPERRYINIKLIRAVLENKKKVLGVAIGMSFIKENERFEWPHILSGIQSLLPSAKIVEGSYFCNKSRTDSTLTIYLDIEKEGGPITLEEERLLKENIVSEFKNRIEQRLNPIFMPQNEETIMRHILTLSGELKYARDLPQIIIDFAAQTEEKIEFLVVALRVAKRRQKTIAASFESKPTFLEYIHDRMHLIGSPRNKNFKKEATVFRLAIRKDLFLRKDHSVDLNKARQEIAKELHRMIGEYRDYNGGMITKENEIFESLRQTVGDNEHLLESFFYALNPPIMRSLLPEFSLKKLFYMLVEAEIAGLCQDASYQISMQYDDTYMYLLIIARTAAFREQLTQCLKPFSGKVATCFIEELDLPCFGLILRDLDEEEALRLRLSVEQILADIHIKANILKY